MAFKNSWPTEYGHGERDRQEAEELEREEIAARFRVEEPTQADCDALKVLIRKDGVDGYWGLHVTRTRAGQAWLQAAATYYHQLRLDRTLDDGARMLAVDAWLVKNPEPE